ncbi:putative translin [Neospora caninum Liverpool]|uniref:Putative translin n=1 Tax=Neospora caninum (strain Liverpool) TaxID=572307 RepID=F0VLR6_NEOCL|nr:putative translin [Neospora caninum Liverpool]CBZ54194.1 putative translin [Neospora caninum Liverpool]CEL68894.1 TPA: translin, putative [Neospora caninum Liverpool]|eukprot:XP_003884225.1 putative translin [Neospora caninum Liverpool]
MMTAAVALSMGDIDGQDFDSMIALYGQEDEQREIIIKKARDILKLAKQAIFALHRRDVELSERNIKHCRRIVAEVVPVTQEFPALRFLGIFVGALEEMAEAEIFYSFISERRLPQFASLHPLRVEEYLGGLMDFTGELNRFAVLRATEQDLDTVSVCRDFVNKIHEKMLLLDLRNSPLRRKYDTLKYTEKKLESLCYELQMGQRLKGVILPSMALEPEPMPKADAEEKEEGK